MTNFKDLTEIQLLIELRRTALEQRDLSLRIQQLNQEVEERIMGYMKEKHQPPKT